MSTSKLINKKFGHFTVLSLEKYKGRTPHYKIRCDCGTVSIKSGANFPHQVGCGSTCPFTIEAREIQRLNAKKRAKKYKIDGKFLTADEIATKINLSHSAVRYRTKIGANLLDRKNPQHKLYRGQPLRYWIETLKITKQGFLYRINRYGVDDDKVYMRSQ